MATTAIEGGDIDALYKSGVVGGAVGGFAATGGFGMVNAWGAKSEVAQFFGRLGYQGISTAGRSIGRNWVSGDDPFSRVTVGVGPVNLTFGEGEQLLQWQNNIGNIATNAIGLANLAAGGNFQFNWKHLTPVYSGGFIGKAYRGMGIRATGAHAVFAINKDIAAQELPHELNHIWHSRALGDAFVPNYFFQAAFPSLMYGSFKSRYQYHSNYFERIGEYGF